MPCPTAFARMIRVAWPPSAGTSRLPRDSSTRPAACSTTSEMRLCTAAVRRRRGELLGGPAGEDEINRADLWMKGEKIQDPSRMASMILTRLV